MAEAVQGEGSGQGRDRGLQHVRPAAGGVPDSAAGTEMLASGEPPIQATERLPPLSVVRLEQSVDRLDRTARSLEDTAHRLLDARGSFWVQVVGWVFLLLFAPMIFLYGASHLPDVWRAKAAAALLGTTSLKGAAGTILEVADERALLRAEWGEELIAINRSRLRDCLSAPATGGGAASGGAPRAGNPQGGISLADGGATCNLILPPPPRRSDLP